VQPASFGCGSGLDSPIVISSAEVLSPSDLMQELDI
jgi:hypothetical protein